MPYPKKSGISQLGAAAVYRREYDIYIYTFKQFQWVSLTGPYQRLEKNVEENKYFEDFLSLRQAGVNLTKSRCSQFCSTDPTSFKQANVEGNILILFRLPRYNSL